MEHICARNSFELGRVVQNFRVRMRALTILVSRWNTDKLRVKYFRIQFLFLAKFMTVLQTRARGWLFLKISWCLNLLIKQWSSPIQRWMIEHTVGRRSTSSSVNTFAKMLGISMRVTLIMKIICALSNFVLQHQKLVL
jgi:hypothetical protein